jgi:hypothetical protein
MDTLQKPTTDFQSFGKIARLSRPMVITEKIDGTNAQIYITQDGEFLTGSRNRWITPYDDNYGFSKWAHEHKDDLMKLGPGRHFGEWWGNGIQRGYGISEKRFSLFNTSRWRMHGTEPSQKEEAPACCHIVPIIYSGEFSTTPAEMAVNSLREIGSSAAPGFMKPEGIIIYHVAANMFFKKTIFKDEEPKSKYNC